jgi:hypothetical protein
MSLENYLINKYNLPSNNNIITPCDFINIHTDFNAYQNGLFEYVKNSLVSGHKLSSIEKDILYYETHKYRHLFELISQTHFNNYFYEVYLILTNDNNLNANTDHYFIKRFNRLYDQRNEISKIGDYTINNFICLINKTYAKSAKYDLINFYNKEVIIKFIKSLNYAKPDITILKNETIKQKVIDIYENYLMPAINIVVEFLTNQIKNNVFSNVDENTKHGLSQFNPKLYMFFISYQTGLRISERHHVDFLYKWAKEYLNYNIKKKNEIIIKLYPNETNEIIKKISRLNQLTEAELLNSSNLLIYENIVDLIKLDPKQHFASENEFIDAYTSAVNKNLNLVKKYGFPVVNKCIIKIVNDHNYPLGYYSDDCFYLNSADWGKNKKYEVESLVLHEAYLGHHTQLDVTYNCSKNKFLQRLYIKIFYSFVEGWALFAENLSTNNNSEYDNYKNLFGKLDSDTLRIFRIIADIDIHYYGKKPNLVMEEMKKYCSFNENMIKSEIVRYTVYPAQAISYKIGQNVFMAIYNNKKDEYKNKYNVNLKINGKYMCNIYNKILLKGSVSINYLADKYGIEFYYR